MQFPEHKGELILNHNPHKSYYEPIDKYIEWNDLTSDFCTEDDCNLAIKTDSLWVLQWYPDTPVGFIRRAGPTLESVLD